jgi:hypothetical protein
MFQDDGLTQLAKNSLGGFLGGFGQSLMTKPPADVQKATNAQRWDWRMIGIIGAVVVGMVLLIRFRK